MLQLLTRRADSAAQCISLSREHTCDQEAIIHYLSARAACGFRRCSLNARMSPSNRCTPCANKP